MQLIVLISFLFPTPNSLVYSFPSQKSELVVNFCVTLARHLLRILCTACSSPHNQPPPFVYFLFSHNNTESYVYWLQFKSLSNQWTYLTSRPPATKTHTHNKTTKKLRKPPSSWSPLPATLRWLQF